jgi:hypothetical protein
MTLESVISEAIGFKKLIMRLHTSASRGKSFEICRDRDLFTECTSLFKEGLAKRWDKGSNGIHPRSAPNRGTHTQSPDTIHTNCTEKERKLVTSWIGKLGVLKDVWPNLEPSIYGRVYLDPRWRILGYPWLMVTG